MMGPDLGWITSLFEAVTAWISLELLFALEALPFVECISNLLLLDTVITFSVCLCTIIFLPPIILHKSTVCQV